MYHLSVHVLHDYDYYFLWTAGRSLGLQSNEEMHLSGVAAKFFLATLC